MNDAIKIAIFTLAIIFVVVIVPLILPVLGAIFLAHLLNELYKKGER